MHQTRFNSFQKSIGSYLTNSLLGPWRRRSISLLSLLFGFYIGSIVTVYFLQEIGQRPIVVLFMFALMELLIRLRTNVNKNPWPLYWLAIDNFRIGTIYSVVLEAFKLGS